MPWVRFTRDFEYRPRPRAIQIFRRGQVLLVTRACAQAAVDSGAAELSSREGKIG